MILTIKQIQAKIKSTKKTRLNVYEGAVTQINEEHLKFDNLISEDHEVLGQLLEDFNELYPNELFTGFLISKGQTTEKGAFIFQFRTDKIEVADHTPAQQDPQTVNSGISVEQMRKEILIELKDKADKENVLIEIRQLKAEIKEKDSLSNKFNGAIENIILKFMSPENASVNGALNGFTERSQEQRQEFSAGGNPGENKSDVNALENAFGILLVQFGEENIIKLANKLDGQNNDGLKGMLINYINS